MILLAKLESVFPVSGRGAVVLPAFLAECPVGAGEPIQLRIPGGPFRNMHISAAEIASGSGKSRLAFMLPCDIAKQDVPEGTEIWLPKTSAENETA